MIIYACAKMGDTDAIDQRKHDEALASFPQQLDDFLRGNGIWKAQTLEEQAHRDTDTAIKQGAYLQNFIDQMVSNGGV